MRPTIALACILKNEVSNLPRLLASVKDCFDEIHLTDTGSTDGSIELIEGYISGANPSGSKIHLQHFQWVSDFSRARNFSFSHPKTDYIMWLDLDDVLHNRDAFIGWRDNILHLGEFWLATYNYSLSPEGKPMCSFARERVVKRELCFTWNYPVHEGMLPKSPKKKDVVLQYAATWSVNHLRSPDDLLQDRSRNIKIFEAQKELCPRLRYYYGKELFENGKPLEGFQQLTSAIAMEGLELHDRIMGIQYACLAAMQLNQFEKAVSLAHQGMQLAPQRAELFVIAGDSYLKMNKPMDAIPMYAAASQCRFSGHNFMQGPIFSMEDAYTHYPLNQLARIHANLGDLDKAREFARCALAYGSNPETVGINKDIDDITVKIGEKGSTKPRAVTTDIVITCPPQGLYEWDGETYRNQATGGSETAAIEVAEWLAKLTGRKVLLFNKRPGAKTINGVEYRPPPDVAEYFRDYKPALHIAWRHVTKLSDDPYYVWCHDLAAAGIEAKGNHKILALSQFHRRYLQHMFGLAAENILITSNGIDPKRFKDSKAEKEFAKIIYSSSPDRGLDRAMLVMDEVVKGFPKARLHVYYGFDNMYKMGMNEQADKLKRMIAERAYVVFHGSISQKELTKEFATACIWFYPTNFCETFCITAIEALCSGVYPVVRKWGGLADTLRFAEAQNMARMIDSDCQSAEQIKVYADAVMHALRERSWEQVTVNPEQYSWENVAKDWIQTLLEEEECLTLSSSIKQR